MDYTLPLDQMTTEEKMRVLQDIWQDLSKNAESFVAPSWHEDVLREREELVRQGKMEFHDFEDVKAELLKK